MKAKNLGLRGWCMNTAEGTVKGYIEGPRTEMRLMREWLKNTGSPASNIAKAEFTHIVEKRDYGFKNFHIRPDEPKDHSNKLSQRSKTLKINGVPN
ncbi:GH19786 [Drosophila grimshawi]|uniref:acylphosphatase n=2 Tax=Drosophila grimshawi TaxID=7222 RepID=B4JRN0_DROGR|nr:GH19786 [Drosophila grimshawi]